MQAPRVSVVIPAYNSAWSIADTIRSVLAQRMVAFEVVIVNDGSTDDLLEVLRPFMSDSRLRVVSQANGGLAVARNRGLAESRAALVAFLDADDVWHPAFLTALTAALEANPSAPFAYGYSLRIDSGNWLISAPRWKRPPRHDFIGLLTLNSVGNGSAALFHAEAVRGVGGYDTSLLARGAQGAEDWKLCLQLARTAPPVLVPRPLLAYRLVEGSMSQRDPARQMRAIRAVMGDLRRQYPDLPAQPFRDAVTLMNGWLLPAFLRKGDYGTVVRMLVESYLFNPFWFRSPEVRAVHREKLMCIALDRGTHVPLADYAEDDERPFAFLRPEESASRQGQAGGCGP